MSTNRLDEETVFHAARRIADPEARAAYLGQACNGDAALRGRVQRLLRTFEQEGDFLAVPSCVATAEMPVTAETPGVAIGLYRLLEVIGEGGMGTVYMADQTHPVRRKVALKVIKSGMDSEQVVARFEAERQALAMMDHPNIAKVIDAGSTGTGRPYVVMELVRGVPITEYCDGEQLPIKERLELFVLICQAVQHAHQKGIIHRDLKPSNVLIAHHDGVPVPKVIDFGIAKATGQSLTEKTYFTGFSQLVGTPLYMSPEQAELSGLDIDTRSDIYSLGVLLYELLTGSTPVDGESLRNAAFDEMRRIIREVEPQKPSTRLSALGEGLSTVSAKRGSDPRQLNRAVRGELDWIVMRSLEKDRARRYQTANDFAADLMRYLNDRPVEASPPSSWYRFVKYARRNRATLISATLAALALVAGTAVSTWEAVRATRAERRAEGALALAEGHRRRSERHLYAFSLRQVQQTIEQGQVERAQVWLASLRDELGEPETSDFGWRYLHRLATREVETFVRHQAGVGPMMLSPDKRYLASGDARGTIVLTDLTSGQVGHQLDGRTGPVKLLAFSLDGRRLAAISESPDSSQQHIAWIWDLATGRRIGKVGPFQSPYFWRLTFSSSGLRLILAFQENEGGPIMVRGLDLGSKPSQPVPLRELRLQPEYDIALDHTSIGGQPYDRGFSVFDTESLQERWSVSGRDLGQSWPSLSADGRRVSIEDGDVIVIRDTATGRELNRQWCGKAERSIVSHALSRDGRRLLVHFKPLRLSVIDLAGGPSLPPCDLALEDPERYDVLRADFSPDGSKVIVMTRDLGGSPGPVTIWESATGRRLATYPGQQRGTSQVLFAPGGESVFLNGGDEVQRWWFERARDEEPQRLGGHQDEAWSLSFSPDGQILASGSDDTADDDTIKLWDSATGHFLKGWRAAPGTVADLAFAPGGRILASASLVSSENLHLWDVASGRLRARLTGHTDKVRSVAFAPDGRTLASAGSDRTVRLWDVATHRLLATLTGHNDVVRKVVFSPDGQTLGSVSNDRTVRLWDVATAREKQTFRGPEKFTAVAFALDASVLAATDEGGDITLWDVATGKRQRSIHGELAPLLALAVSPDGRTLAAAGASRSIRVWDVLTGQELLNLRGHTAQINGLVFSPNGRILASCSHDGAIQLWNGDESEKPSTFHPLRRDSEWDP